MDKNNLNNIPPQVQSPVIQNGLKRPLWISITILILVVLALIAFFVFKKSTNNTISLDSNAPVLYQEALVNVPFIRQEININPAISQKFSTSEIKNIADIEKAYGFKFTPEELAKLEQNKFVTKNLLDTNITANGLNVSDNIRELVALYSKVSGNSDVKNRTQANSLFISSDSIMNLFSILSADLLKETENKYLYNQTLAITKAMYEQADVNLRHAKSADEKNEWAKVRDYFAVPYALLSTSMKPINAEDYWNSEYSKNGQSIDVMQADFEVKDKEADSYDKATTFIKNLNLGATEETAVLADLKQIYDASETRGTPKIFESEFAVLPPNVQVSIPFTLFKPRGTYTSSSLRRQYFRAVQWYQQIPFLMGSKDLTEYAVDIGQLIHANQDIENQYKSFSSLIAFIVGESDDLDVNDYAAAAKDLGNKAHDQKALGDYLAKRKPEAKIKALPVNINPNAGITLEDEIRAMRGMRFMSQKFIPDSYWTSKLTQGDETPAVNGQKLPDNASVLEVMSILGSTYATSRLSDLPFYTAHKLAIDNKLGELKSESNSWSDNYWRSNLYTSTLWSISGMFNWLTTNKSMLPQFMQSPLWDAKTLLTNAGFWTELRHTSLLYAKQSFAEKGGGGSDSCDLRKVPDAAKGYVEPQAEAYDRLYYTAQRLAAEYKARGFELKNQPQLENYIKLLNTVREYTKLELENNTFNESIISQTRHSYDDNTDCTEFLISPDSSVKRSEDGYNNPKSRWEELRVDLIAQMRASLPLPVEGPIIQIKDKRAAVVADVHTDKAGGVLEEGTGVPRVIFVAVKDANGPRLTVGFTYSQYETMSSDRLTDEQWQNNFYTDSDDYLITYKPKSTWPNINTWFQELLGNK